MSPSNPQIIKCVGCGACLQTDNQNKEGYIPASALSRDEESLYCQRCFKLRHYNELIDVDLAEYEYKKILAEISEKKALIVMVVDLFDVEGTFIEGIQRFAFNNELIVLANKFDLLPASTKESSIRQWVMKRSHEMGLRPAKVLVASAKKRQYIDQLIQSIEELRKGKDVYFVGASNVGKSTLINSILSQAIADDSLITTSYFPGTTLGKIEIPLDDGSYLIDTPGIIQKGQLNYQLEAKDLKAVTPKKRMKAKTYQLNPGQSILLGGLAKLDIDRCLPKSSVVVYSAEGVKIHRTKTEKSFDIIQSLSGQELTPPYQPNHYPLEWKKQSYSLKEESDVLISGLAWVRLPSDVTVTLWLSLDVDVYIRPAMI